jgi:hypothetical protein
MNIKSLVIPGTLVLSLSLAVLPASAQQRRGRDGSGRQNAPARVERQQAAPRQAPAPGYDARGYGARRDGGRPVYVAPRAVAPYRVQPRVVAPYGPRSHGRPYDYGRRPYFFSRPYYAFRPRISIGFGIWLGYPVPYPYVPYGYGYPYPYSYPPAAPPYPGSGYPQAPGGSAEVAVAGGVSFEITPADAAVYVDGSYAGTCGEFTANSQPLTLEPGRHRIEVQAEGYRPMVFDTDIIAGQVIPYRGTLQPY